MKLFDLDRYPSLKDGHCQQMTTWDGLAVRVATWPALRSNPKGTVSLLQGRAEFIEKYYEVIEELRARGFAVVTMDWRGQGGSERQLPDPLKGHVRSFADYGKDLKQLIHETVLPDCPPPHFALTHSMGGLILLQQLPRMRTVFDRALLSTPLIELAQEQRKFVGITLRHSTIRRFTSAMRLIGKGKRYVPSADKTPFDRRGFYHNPLTSDGPRYDRNRQYLIDHPELAIAGPTNSWTNEAIKALQSLRSSDFQIKIHTPTLMITASLDEIVDSKAAEYFAQILRSGHAVSIPGSRHEIMMEKDLIRAQFWAAFDSFIPGTKIGPDTNNPE